MGEAGAAGWSEKLNTVITDGGPLPDDASKAGLSIYKINTLVKRKMPALFQIRQKIG